MFPGKMNNIHVKISVCINSVHLKYFPNVVTIEGGTIVKEIAWKNFVTLEYLSKHEGNDKAAHLLEIIKAYNDQSS